nr:MAG TPA: hypothetical protein [Caudoviricetes sp.]
MLARNGTVRPAGTARRLPAPAPRRGARRCRAELQANGAPARGA